MTQNARKLESYAPVRSRKRLCPPRQDHPNRRLADRVLQIARSEGLREKIIGALARGRYCRIYRRVRRDHDRQHLVLLLNGLIQNVDTTDPRQLIVQQQNIWGGFHDAGHRLLSR